MCGIAGYFQPRQPGTPDTTLIRRMVASLQHRGPDEFGVYFDRTCALGQARLSIIDLSGGSQPMANEDESIWITFNGEIFNYLELRQELIKAGHRFRTNSDTEVIVHAYEQWGRACLDRFNGQFAFALYNRRNRSLFAARDRLGIRPFFYARHQERFYFASEIKAIFCDLSLPRAIDPVGLDQIFTWWTTAPPRTAFEGISELAAGCWLEITADGVKQGRYWSQKFATTFDHSRSLGSWTEELHALLVDSVRLRLRADVPVGAYLSGGLDSSATTALIRNFTDTPVETFSVAFQDKAFDESDYQDQMAAFLGTRHHRINCGHLDIAEAFPDVIWHTERPLVRTAPTPLFLLSRLVREHDFKVVLTGEGSDEIFGGYDLYKETLIRRFWARQPQSKWRPLLLGRLYPTLPLSGARARFYLETFYRKGLADTEAYHFSHLPRINTTSRVKEYFTNDFRGEIGNYEAITAFEPDLPEAFADWHHLCRAQWLESSSLLAGYLLSSQGDRMSAAHAVEGRYPFLDHRLVEFASGLPPYYKLRGLNEKYILKKAMAAELPAEIINRVKQPYMAPDSNCFVQDDSPEYVNETLSEGSLAQAGIFKPQAVQALRRKATKLSHAHLSFGDNMSFIGILSTQLLWERFLRHYRVADPLEQPRFTVWVDGERLGVTTGRNKQDLRRL
ncbi:MAG: asparagine synthase (glutamine-hydrolyzing) [bacterium]